jgi:hypothetical protein
MKSRHGIAEIAMPCLGMLPEQWGAPCRAECFGDRVAC